MKKKLIPIIILAAFQQAAFSMHIQPISLDNNETRHGRINKSCTIKNETVYDLKIFLDNYLKKNIKKGEIEKIPFSNLAYGTKKLRIETVDLEPQQILESSFFTAKNLSFTIRINNDGKLVLIDNDKQ